MTVGHGHAARPRRQRRLARRVAAAPEAARTTTTALYPGLPLADLPVSSPGDVEDAFARARIAQKLWAALPLRQRKKVLLRFHDLVLARRDEALDLMHEAGLPADVWQMVVGRGSSLGGTLMENADYMMFTGSTASGRRIARDAGQRLIGASLELGGKNAMIVLDDADIDKAADGAVAACFPSAGQLCVSIERLYVAESLRDRFVAAFVARTKRLRIGAAYDYGVDVGSLTNPSQLETVTSHVDDAVAKGATVLAGGRARPDLGPLFYEPTILTHVTPDMTLHDHETFGPVVSVYSFRTVDEAVARANATPYGLNAAVWTGNGSRGRAVAARVHAGTVNVNEAFAAAWGSVDAPMGGVGDSGLGRRHGADGILKYTEPQTVAHQRVLGFTPPARVSHGTWAVLLTRALRMMKAAGVR
ncbi:succinic semialdehyde dehydrogenase [Streptomyces sp. NPDC001185]|uniref:succinic semialdehyde dehydrogenase n=1 Tax=Streptomyces sp. NPDC001185 TaxID=3154380 RepID=UPI003320CC09